jgi:hypothetical protein
MTMTPCPIKKKKAIIYRDGSLPGVAARRFFVKRHFLEEKHHK